MNDFSANGGVEYEGNELLSDAVFPIEDQQFALSESVDSEATASRLRLRTALDSMIRVQPAGAGRYSIDLTLGNATTPAGSYRLIASTQKRQLPINIEDFIDTGIGQGTIVLTYAREYAQVSVPHPVSAVAGTTIRIETRVVRPD